MDNVNSVGDFLRYSFSSLVNKDGKIFKALVANPEGTGTIERVFSDIEAAREEWCNNPDLYNQNGEILEKTLSFFSFLSRLFEESDESLKKRNELLFYRGGDTVWGDTWNIRKIFRLYFNTDSVYIVNNTNSIGENLLRDGDFEKQTDWELDGCSHDISARFSERIGIKFEDYGICSQSVLANTESTYFLHFFLRGKLNVQITDNNGRYWNKNIGEFGGWTTAETSDTFNSEEWDAKSIFFLTDDQVSGVTIKFVGVHNESAMLDYVRLFLKENYPSFTMIVVFGGIYTDDTMGMAPGKDDPVVRRNYDGFGHFSDGKDDQNPVDIDSVSFIEGAAINEDKDPVMAPGTNDIGDIKAANDMYADETTPLAPWEEDESGMDVDYSRMSYIEQSHLFGMEGGAARAESVYTELLEMVRAGGIISYIELLTRELDE
jgi:hypothetical protein